MKNDTLKLFGIIFMIIDHIGLCFFPHIMAFRIIGRLSFPIFAYFIANGYRKTSNLKKYMVRLLIFAIISQPIFYIFAGKGLNIFFTLLIGLISIYAIDNKYYLLLSIILLTSCFIPLDYGLYGVVTIIIFYLYMEQLSMLLIALVLLNILYALKYQLIVQAFSIFSLFFIKREWKTKIHLNKYIGYVFYPSHLLILILLKYIF